MIGVGVNVVSTGVGLPYTAAPVQAAINPFGGAVTQMVSVTMSVV